MKVTVKGNVLTIDLDMQKPAPSASGKTLIVATTGGGQKSEAEVSGKQVVVSVNAWVSK